MTFDDIIPETLGGSRRWLGWLLVSAMVVVLLGGAGAAAWLNLREEGPDHPDQWDSRVLDLVEFVEAERGFEFEHPIHVDFLTDEEFREDVTADEAALTDEEREEIEQFAGLMRAVGLIEGDVDLFAASNELSGTAVVGLYDLETERIRVRGHELTVNGRVTLVHELTHALQDQHFDVDRFDDLETDGEALAWRAVIEGDASRIEGLYVDQLSEEDAAAYDEQLQEEAQEVPPGFADIPDSMQAYFGAPYALGDAFLGMIEAVSGVAGINDLFHAPPTTEEQLLDPWVFLDHQPALDVDSPELADDEELIDDGDFGVLTWYLMLAERLDPLAALDAVDGWGGDAYVAFVRDGVTCARIAYEGDDAAETEQMINAVREWIGALPGGTASVEPAGAGFLLESCDPGVDAQLNLPGRSTQVIAIPVIRTYLATDALESGALRPQARCFANDVMHAFPSDRFTGENAEVEPSPAESAVIQDVVERCR